MENSEAGKLLNSIHGPSSRAVYHPERLRKNRYSLTIAASGSGGVNDMQEIGCGKDWEDAFADMWKQSITELEAKLAAQLDAETPAEPVEDVPPGYVKLEDVEKAIQKEINRYHESAAIHLYDDLVPNVLAHLKESSLAEEKLLNRRTK